MFQASMFVDQKALNGNFSRPSIEDMKYKIIKLSARGFSASKISKKLSIDKRTVYKWIKRFNEEGYLGLKGKKPTGRPVLFNGNVSVELDNLINNTREVWTLGKLKAILKKSKVVKSISLEKLRQILVKSNRTYHKTLGWI